MKIALVLNRKVSVPIQMNAAAHLCIGLQDFVERSTMKLRHFSDKSGLHASTMTDYPLIVFSARNSEHLREAHRLALDVKIPCNAFFDCMRSADPDMQDIDVRSRGIDEQVYIGIALFGSSEQIKPLTRRFSLLRDGGGADGPTPDLPSAS